MYYFSKNQKRALGAFARF